MLLHPCIDSMPLLETALEGYEHKRPVWVLVCIQSLENLPKFVAYRVDLAFTQLSRAHCCRLSPFAPRRTETRGFGRCGMRSLQPTLCSLQHEVQRLKFGLRLSHESAERVRGLKQWIYRRECRPMSVFDDSTQLWECALVPLLIALHEEHCLRRAP